MDASLAPTSEEPSVQSGQQRLPPEPQPLPMDAQMPQTGPRASPKLVAPSPTPFTPAATCVGAFLYSNDESPNPHFALPGVANSWQ